MRHSRRGNALVEFALSASVLIAIMLGTFQFGYTFYVYDQLQSAIRNGARYASLIKYKSSSTCTASRENSVKNMTVYGQPITTVVTSSADLPSGVVAKVKGLTADNVDVDYDTDASGVPTTVTVRIVNFTVGAVVGSTTFNKPVAVAPYLGTYASEATCP